MGCLYLLTSPSGKSYIGITSKTVEARWKAHNMRVQEGRDQALQKAIRKYGAESFKVQTLVIADKWDYLCDLERKAIAAFNTKAPNGYNLTDGGEGIVGRVHTEQASANMSAGQKRRARTDEEKKRLADLGKQYWNSPVGIARKEEAKAKNEAARKARLETLPERRSQAVKAAMQRSDVKAKVLACAAKRAADPEWRKKVSASKMGQGLGSKRSAETKAKQAEARRQWWARKHAQKATKLHED